MPVSKCTCGKRKSKFMNYCMDCTKDQHDKANAEARAIVKIGKCPKCGAALKRNYSLPGWYQCEQAGAEGFRKDPSKPSCSFQTFTE